MSFNQFLVILRARWRIAVTVFFMVVVLIAFASIIWPKQYTATASIVIDSKSDPIAATGGAAGGMQPQATYVDTQADIIASERVAQRVVKTLKLDQQPEARKLWARGPNDDISVKNYRHLSEGILRVLRAASRSRRQAFASFSGKSSSAKASAKSRPTHTFSLSGTRRAKGSPFFKSTNVTF